VQHISDLHSKFAVGPHHVWNYGRHPICAADIRRGKKKKTERNHGKNIMSASATQGRHNERHDYKPSESSVQVNY